MPTLTINSTTTIDNTPKTIPSSLGNTSTITPPSANVPAATAIDVGRYTKLHFAPVIAPTTSTADGAWNKSNDNGYSLGKLRLKIESAPRANGPWRRVYEKSDFSGMLDPDRFTINDFDRFIRAAWSRPNGPIPPVSIALTAEAESDLDDAARWQKEAADAAAATLTAEQAVYRNGSGVERTISAVRFIPSAALTADNTNYATLTVAKRDAAGGNATTVASVTTEITGSGDWTAFAAVDFGTIVSAALPDGWALTVAIAKAGSGVAVPAGQLEVSFSD